MEWLFVAAVVPVAFAWYVGGGSICRAVMKTERKVREQLTCSADADCPPGFICINGQCQPAS